MFYTGFTLKLVMTWNARCCWD